MQRVGQKLKKKTNILPEELEGRNVLLHTGVVRRTVLQQYLGDMNMRVRTRLITVCIGSNGRFLWAHK